MQMPAEPIPHELLLRHAGFLRRLARDLLGDPSAADDAVQEVWLRALEKPPRHGSNVRGWLRVVLTNLVRSNARGVSRREAREREHAVDSGRDLLGTNPTDEATLRSVTEAVLALEEPLRTTVLQHYFQGLSTTEIAQRDHLPVSTVKSRLQRALEILRVRMKRDCGDSWRASLFALAVPSKIGKGVILMSLKTKLAIASLALIASILVYQSSTADPERTLDSAGGLAASRPALDGSAQEDPRQVTNRDVADRRAQVTATTPAPPAVADSHLDTRLFGTLQDPEGKPVAVQAIVVLTDSEARRRQGEVKSDGTFEFRSIPFGNYWALIGADGFVTSEQELELRPEQPQLRRDFTLQEARSIKVYATTPDGEILTEALTKVENRPWFTVLVPVATETRPDEWMPEVRGPSSTRPFGIGRFKDEGPRMKDLLKGGIGILELNREPPLFVSLTYSQRVLKTIELTQADAEVHFVLSIDEVIASLATVRMQVVDAENSTPLANAVVRLEDGLVYDVQSTSDTSGIAVIKRCNPGEYQLRITAVGYETIITRVLADSGVVTELGQVALRPEVRFEAEVIGPDGSLCSGSFLMGVLDPSTSVISHWKDVCSDARYGTDSGVLRVRGLGRKIYALQTAPHSFFGEQDRRKELVSGNVVIDLRSGAPPTGFKIRLRPASQLLIHVNDGLIAGLRYRIEDETGLELDGGRFYQSAPISISVPEGIYRVQLLDSVGSVLTTKTVTIDSTTQTVELSR